MNNDYTLLDAINECNKSKIDDVKSTTDLYDFMLAFSQKMSSAALLFLHDNYGISFRYIFSRIDVTYDQMKMLLRNGYKPSKNMIFTYSGYLDLSLFNLLLDYGIKIPEEIVLRWENVEFANALNSYLEHGGKPNIRPFSIKNRRVGKYELSLIDRWIIQQDDNERDEKDVKIINYVVTNLIKHGAKKSPYAMTKQEQKAYLSLQEQHPQKFVIAQRKKIAKIKEYMNSVQDKMEYIECSIAIEKFETDIKMCHL